MLLHCLIKAKQLPGWSKLTASRDRGAGPGRSVPQQSSVDYGLTLRLSHSTERNDELATLEDEFEAFRSQHMEQSKLHKEDIKKWKTKVSRPSVALAPR